MYVCLLFEQTSQYSGNHNHGITSLIFIVQPPSGKWLFNKAQNTTLIHYFLFKSSRRLIVIAIIAAMHFIMFLLWPTYRPEAWFSNGNITFQVQKIFAPKMIVHQIQSHLIFAPSPPLLQPWGQISYYILREFCDCFPSLLAKYNLMLHPQSSSPSWKY